MEDCGWNRGAGGGRELGCERCGVAASPGAGDCCTLYSRWRAPFPRGQTLNERARGDAPVALVEVERAIHTPLFRRLCGDHDVDVRRPLRWGFAETVEFGRALVPRGWPPKRVKSFLEMLTRTSRFDAERGNKPPS